MDCNSGVQFKVKDARYSVIETLIVSNFPQIGRRFQSISSSWVEFLYLCSSSCQAVLGTEMEKGLRQVPVIFIEFLVQNGDIEYLCNAISFHSKLN